MKIMAQEGEYFNIGSIVSCTTCYNQKLQGEVLAFDVESKMLAIKSSAASGKHNVHDVRMVNLNYCSEVKVVKESDDPPPALPNLSLQKLNNRLNATQKVFNSIVKTLAESRWEGKNIIVMEEVTIRPPYGVDDCQGKQGSQVLNHVRKIIQKHVADEAQRDQRKSMSPSTVTSLKS
ncbi:LSM12 [Mytilus edulis]|uniref:LSM12 n=1 Tax=Mytilus edulis TaxID=6550 RepID=A0A8S3Q852_MYTED|nr:LSM12 [Mytilus edulis]